MNPVTVLVVDAEGLGPTVKPPMLWKVPPPDKLPFVDKVNDRVGVPLQGMVTDDDAAVGTAIGDGRMCFGDGISTGVTRVGGIVLLTVSACSLTEDESGEEVVTTGLTSCVETGGVTDEEEVDADGCVAMPDETMWMGAEGDMLE